MKWCLPKSVNDSQINPLQVSLHWQYAFTHDPWIEQVYNSGQPVVTLLATITIEPFAPAEPTVPVNYVLIC